MASLDRRSFLSRIGAAGLAVGAAPLLAAACDEAEEGPDLFSPRESDSDARIFAAARRELYIPQDVTFCNTGTLGACPREVLDAVADAARMIEETLPEWAYRPTDGDEPPPPMTGYRPLPRIREELAKLVNATADEIALTQNATMGMSMLANGVELARGDEVLTTDQEHPSGISPWLLREKRHGAVVRQIALLPLAEKGPEAVVQGFADAITPRTRVVTFSHVTSTLGIRLPVRELCELARSRGAIAIVDGAQVPGQILVDVREIGCDAYVISTHKWMGAPKGTGLLYVRSEAQDNFWSTLVTSGYDDRATGAYRFMHFGTGSMPQVLGLRAASRFMTRLGLERVARWDAMLTARLREGLAKIPHVTMSTPANPAFASALTTFAVTGRESAAVQDELWAHRIRVRAQGERGVRLSAHWFVSPEEIDRVLGVVAEMA